jgi:putative transposase
VCTAWGLRVVWCSKYRRRVLGGRIAARLRGLIGQKGTGKGGEIIAVGVMPDHVHRFVEQEPKGSASSVANRFTGYPSGVLRGSCRTCARDARAVVVVVVVVRGIGRWVRIGVRRYLDTRWERPWTKEKAGPDARRV